MNCDVKNETVVQNNDFHTATTKSQAILLFFFGLVSESAYYGGKLCDLYSTCLQVMRC